MKNLKYLCFALLACFLFACSENLTVNYLRIEVNEVTVGEELELKIKTRDDDGIKYVQIVIPILSVDFKIEDNGSSDINIWEINRHFLVEDDINGTFEVFITLVDYAGEEYMETEKFSIK